MNVVHLNLLMFCLSYMCGCGGVFIGSAVFICMWKIWVWVWKLLNTLRPRKNGRHFADDIFKCIFLNENVWIPIKIALKLVPRGPINNIPTLVQVMAWRRPGDKPLSEPMMVRLPTHICVTRPQWVNWGLCNKRRLIEINIFFIFLCTDNYIIQIMWI